MSSGFLSLTFPSVQENDLLVQSTKKIKNLQDISESTVEEVMADANAHNLSYKDKLLLNGMEDNVDENLSLMLCWTTFMRNLISMMIQRTLL
ncbi:hypothetical protein SLE2022_333700 [Rubroshorea leprosula]